MITQFSCVHRQLVSRATGIARCTHPRVVAQGGLVDREICVSCLHRVNSPAPNERPPNVADCAVIIPCHNYGRFLAECLDSVLAQTLSPSHVVVVDDSSTDNTAAIVQKYADRGVTYARVEHRNPHATRGFGLSLVRNKYVLFLDADNSLPPKYLEAAIGKLESDRSIAFVYPVLERIGDRTGRHLTPPPQLTSLEIAGRNVCDASSVIRRELLVQSLTFCRRIETNAMEDWRMFREVLESGPWRAVRNDVPLNYRIHRDQRSRAMRAKPSYWNDASLERETVTVVLTASGRWSLWPRRLHWLKSLTWPKDRLRVLVANTSHSEQTAASLGIADFACAGVSVYDHPVGAPGLADLDRRVSGNLCRDVDAAVAAIYNRAAMEANSEYLAIVEDDVFPHAPDWIERLMHNMGPKTAAVSAKYHHRYQPEKCVAFHVQEPRFCTLLPMTCTGRQQIDGTGFGALVIRRSVLHRFPLAADQASHAHYDLDLGRRLKAAGWQWWLDADVSCDHECGSAPVLETAQAN